MRALLIRIAWLSLVASCTDDCHDPVRPNIATDRIIWSAPLPGWVDGVSAVTQDAIYAATDSGLAAVDRTSGELRWFVRATGYAGSKRLVVRNGRVFAAGVYAVRAHDTATGAVLWENTYDTNRSAPDFSKLAIDDAALYVGLRDGRALALSQTDGHVLWEAAIATPEWSYMKLLGGSTLGGDTVFVTATRSLSRNNFEQTAVVVALDRLTGRELWRYQYAGKDMTASAGVLVSGSLVFTDVRKGYVTAVNTTNGTERWRQLMYGFILGAPAVRGDTVFVSTGSSRAYALDAMSGRKYWTAVLDAGSTAVAPCGSEVIVEDFSIEVRRAADGKPVGFVLEASDEEVATSAIEVEGKVAYVGTNKRLLAIRCN